MTQVPDTSGAASDNGSQERARLDESQAGLLRQDLSLRQRPASSAPTNNINTVQSARSRADAGCCGRLGPGPGTAHAPCYALLAGHCVSDERT